MQEVAAKRCQDEPEAEASPRAERVSELFSEHGDFVWRTLGRLGVAVADADEALQETFLIAFRPIDEYQNRGWLARERFERAIARRTEAEGPS